jgi:hypothetical protein
VTTPNFFQKPAVGFRDPLSVCPCLVREFEIEAKAGFEKAIAFGDLDSSFFFVEHAGRSDHGTSRQIKISH